MFLSCVYLSNEVGPLCLGCRCTWTHTFLLNRLTNMYLPCGNHSKLHILPSHSSFTFFFPHTSLAAFLSWLSVVVWKVGGLGVTCEWVQSSFLRIWGFWKFNCQEPSPCQECSVGFFVMSTFWLWGCAAKCARWEFRWRVVFQGFALGPRIGFEEFEKWVWGCVCHGEKFWEGYWSSRVFL